MVSNSGDGKGLQCEVEAEQIFKTIISSRRSDLPCRIINVVRAEKNSMMDKSKRDLELTCVHKGKIFVMPIQVKASFANITRHIRACRRLGVYIPVLVVNLKKSFEELLEIAVAFLRRHVPVFMGSSPAIAEGSSNPRNCCKRHGHWNPRPQRFAMVH